MLGDNLIIEQVVDTLVNAPVKNLVSDNTGDWFSLRNLVDLFYKLATVLIALFNVGFAVYIYRTKDKKEDDNKEADRRIGLLKTLILDYNLKHVYSFFDDLETHLSVLRDPGANKVAVEQNIQVLFKGLNEKFIYFPLNPQLHSRSATYIKRNGLLIRKITIKSSRPFQCAYHPLTP